MSYQFPPDLQKLLHEQMTSGAYGSEDEVLREALKALQEQRQLELEDDPIVIEGIRRGLADVAEGRMRTFTEFDAQFRSDRGL